MNSTVQYYPVQWPDALICGMPNFSQLGHSESQQHQENPGITMMQQLLQRKKISHEL